MTVLFTIPYTLHGPDNRRNPLRLFDAPFEASPKMKAIHQETRDFLGRAVSGAHHQALWPCLWAPLIAFATISFSLAYLNADEWLADYFYGLQGNRWALRRHFITDDLIHDLGRVTSILAWLCAFSAWIVARAWKPWSHLHPPLGRLLIATLLATLLVAWIKSWTNMDCPWDLHRYGGSRPFIGLFSQRPEGLPQGRCFPAGHASGGYAWMSLYFFFVSVKPRWRWLGLAIGVIAGLVFGVAQQLRGAHFLSHDLWTIAVCWITALTVHLIAQRHPAQERGATSGEEPWASGADR
ncbi:phosphatase PAP2 family protein [Pseudoxanthomonas sp. UTMC 1351]|uniref:phosphatase PAP2 family protein n=1 Tax=Pseudoxanthomonas sp. UTMC 1351 TaxID=2695853 RepID=UPI0034CE7878